ncbi:insulinase family protein [bacterium]|nr:insulinase family protein [bacterium]
MNFNPTMYRLSNGVTVILDPMDLETVAIKVLFRTGSRDEAPTEYGLTHFCEHMLCNSTARFASSKDRREFLDDHGGTHNAATGNDRLYFHGRILAENINVLIDVISDQLQNALFEPNKIDIERRVVIDELRRALDNPQRQFGDFVSEKLFNYATFSTRGLGTEELIQSFTRDQMIEFLGRRLSAKNCIIGISGRIIDPDAVLRHLETSFAFLPNRDVPENDAITYTPTIAHNSKPDKKNVVLSILFPDVWDATYENRFRNKCVGKFCLHMNRELFDVIRRENGLVYGFAGDGAGNEKFGLTGFNTQTAPENVERVVALIAQNAHKIYTQHTITDDDLRRMTCRNRLSRADWMESASSRCDKLIRFWRHFGRVFDLDADTQMSESVRRDDVIENARGFFDGPMSIITQGADFDVDLNAVWRDNFK